MANSLEFRVSTGLKDIIGKDLITDEFIAVFELVKNSYDARAKNVSITIEDDKIVIADDGKGMSLDDLNNKWLFVAFSAKKDGTEDEYLNQDKSYRDKIQERRHYAGAKGIGRFSCDRLGRFLTVITQKEKLDLIEQIKVDWSKFEVDQKEVFQKVKVDHDTIKEYSIPFPKDSLNGTILEITGLYTNWNRERLKQLKHSLEKLINPFSETNDFNIEIICKREEIEDNTKDNGGIYKYIERDRVNGPVKNSILQILEIKTTQLSVEINSESIISKIIDRGNLIYSIKEKNSDFPFLSNLRMDLFFLNNSAKNNFTRKMGIEPVNFGSIFLFKNGFRVQPYGNPGDDSWGLDYRAQQGYNRFLGTRDLFGRIEIQTDDTDQFKEVSSRDGGLVETFGYYQIMKAFKEKGLVRLERYVVGVLWGEGFKRKKYFGEGKDANLTADNYRKNLQDYDKISDNVNSVKSNLGSKIDFIQIIKSLASNKDVEILEYDKEFINLINDKLDENQSRFISDLHDIAEQTHDEELKEKILDEEKRYQQLLLEKDEAEKKALDEENKRIEAESKAKKEEEARIRAEKKQKEEEEKRRLAEVATLIKEKERAEAVIAKLLAERTAKEEAEKRIKEEQARIKAENEVLKRKEQISRYKAAETIEYKDLRDSNHIIGVYSDDISKKILLLKRKLDRGQAIDNNSLISFIQGVSLANEKISTLTRFTTKSGFLQASLETEEDIVSYISKYIKNIYQILYKIEIEIIDNGISFQKKFQPIELCVALDNILSNSRKKNAKKIILEFENRGEMLSIKIRDVGEKLSESIKDWKLIFEEGVTTTKGSGLGLNHVKRIIEDDLGGEIIYNPEYKNGFELIISMKK